jgi:hypothetical protein
MRNPIYVVTDVEIDGPTPGRHSMLSFASVAVGHDGRELDVFEAVLGPLDGAAPDPHTLSWFNTQAPEAYAAATRNPQPPGEVMAAYVEWVRGLPGEPIFAAHPLAFDGVWIDHYLRTFTENRLVEAPWVPTRLFKHPGLCLASFAAGRLGWPVWECSTERYPAEWLGRHAHTHRAIDDARGYAHLLGYLIGLSAPPRT